ncbi:MAG: Gfo/Idh/MocA family oxidoreductase [Candidatus Latescibacteria bacterium]|nr:Gfo/Idh/MocA family oxidoreductase [Candidatus Latescibacterota bacterium]
MPPIRLGGIGCGGMAAGVHFPAIQRIPELQLVALCDLDEARLAETADRFRVSHTFVRFEEMLDSGLIDAVSIIGPPSLHVIAGRACLLRQIPFMTEKPLALTVAEATSLADLADQHGDCGQVGFTNRFAPAQRLAWRISRLPEFGPLCFVATTHLTHCRMSPFWDIENGVEAFIHLHGVHAIDLWRFFGGDPVEVSASVAGLRPLGPPHHAYGSILVSVRTSDGPHGTIQMKASASHNGDINADVMGERGRVRVENDQCLTYERGLEWVRQVMGDDVLADTFLTDQPAGQFLGTGNIMHSYWDFFRYEWMAFARTLLAGASFSPSIRDGAKTVCLTDAICASLRAGGAPTPVSF